MIKLSPDANTVLYASYFWDEVAAIATDSQGNLYLTGEHVECCPSGHGRIHERSAEHIHEGCLCDEALGGRGQDSILRRFHHD